MSEIDSSQSSSAGASSTAPSAPGESAEVTTSSATESLTVKSERSSAASVSNSGESDVPRNDRAHNKGSRNREAPDHANDDSHGDYDASEIISGQANASAAHTEYDQDGVAMNEKIKSVENQSDDHDQNSATTNNENSIAEKRGGEDADPSATDRSDLTQHSSGKHGQGYSGSHESQPATAETKIDRSRLSENTDESPNSIDETAIEEDDFDNDIGSSGSSSELDSTTSSKPEDSDVSPDSYDDDASSSHANESNDANSEHRPTSPQTSDILEENDPVREPVEDQHSHIDDSADTIKDTPVEEIDLPSSTEKSNEEAKIEEDQSVKRGSHPSTKETNETKDDGKDKPVAEKNEERGADSETSSDHAATEVDGVTAEKSESELSTTSTTKSTPQPVDDDEEDGPREKVLVDYASKLAGAQVLEKSPSLKGTSNLLTGDIDRYAIAPCDDKKYVVIGLSEDILVKQIKLSNYERYSSHVREFQVLASQEYPAPSEYWTDLGVYEAKPRNGEQAFELKEPAWARYLKFRFLTHYGAEHYCTFSQIKVHGSTMLQGFHEQWIESEKQDRVLEEQEANHEAEEISANDEDSDLVVEDGDEESIQHNSMGNEQEDDRDHEQSSESVGTTDIRDSGSKEEDESQAEDLSNHSSDHPSVKDENCKGSTCEVAVDNDASIETDSESDESSETISEAPGTAVGKNVENSIKRSSDLTDEGDELIPPPDAIALTNEGEEPEEETKIEKSVNHSITTQDSSKVEKGIPDALSDDEESDSDSAESGYPITKENMNDTIAETNGIDKEMDQEANVTSEEEIETTPTEVVPVKNDSSIFAVKDAMKAAVADATDVIKNATHASSVQMSGAVNEIKKIIRTKMGSKDDETDSSTGAREATAQAPNGKNASSVVNTTKEDDTPISKSDSIAPKKDQYTSEDASPSTEQRAVKSIDGNSNSSPTSDSGTSAVSSPHKRTSTLREEPKTVVASTKELKRQATPNEFIAKISNQFPRASCIKDLDFQAFKSKTLLSHAGSASHVGGAAKMEPIFTKITSEIKSVQVTQHQYEQYISAIKSCYEQVFSDMAESLDEMQMDFDDRLRNLEASMLELNTIKQNSSVADQGGTLFSFLPLTFAHTLLPIPKIVQSPEILFMFTGITAFIILVSWPRTKKKKAKPASKAVVNCSTASQSSPAHEIPAPTPKMHNGVQFSKEDDTIVTDLSNSLPSSLEFREKNVVGDSPESLNIIGSSGDSICSTPSAKSEPLGSASPTIKSRKNNSPRTRFRLKKRL